MTTLGRKMRRDLRQRKWQYGAVALTIFLGTMAFAASYDAYRNLDASYGRTYDRLALADMTVTGADPSFASDARRLEGVATVERRLQADVPMRVGGAHFVGRLVALPSIGRGRLNKIDIVEGSAPPGDGTDAAVAETHLYDHFELELGDTVSYHDGDGWRDLEIVGSAVSPEYLWPARSAQDVLTPPGSFGVLFVDESLIATLPPAVVEDQVLVGYRRDADGSRLDRAVTRAAERADATSVVPAADQASNKALQADMLGFQQMAYAFPALFLAAAGLATYTLMTRLVLQERVLIGTLRANGLSRSEVVGHYLSYGLWIGCVAALLGVAVAVPLGWLMTYAYTEQLGIPDTVRDFRWTTVLVGVAFGIVTGLVSAWVPARYAARQDPAEAMRGQTNSVEGRRSLVERLAPIGTSLSARGRMVLRGVTRNRRRSLSTVVGVVLALVLTIAAWGLLDSTDFLIQRQFDQIQHDDATVVFAVPVDEPAVERVEDTDGVRSAELVNVLSVGVKHARATYATNLIAFDARTRMREFDDPLPAEGVVLGEQLRDRLEVEKGDHVTLTFPSLGSRLRVPVAGFVSEPLGTLAYMRRDALARALTSADPPVADADLAQPENAVVMARFEEGSDRDAVIDELATVEGVAAVRDSRSLVAYFEEFMGLFYLLVGIMLAFGGLLAVALLFTTMSANMAERAAELAMMRANGYSRREVARLVVWENMLLTAIAIPIGLVAGYVVARALMASYTTDMFTFPLHISPRSYALSAAAMIAVTLASLWPGLRAVERMDLGWIVRQRST